MALNIGRRLRKLARKFKPSLHEKRENLEWIRKLDQEGFRNKGGCYSGSGLGNYGLTFGTDFVKRLNALAKKKGSPAKVWDVGCGQGVFLRELKESLGNKVVTTGTSASMPPNKQGIDKMHVVSLAYPRKKGSFAQSKEKFDLIVAHQSEVREMKMENVIKHVLSRLAPGGKAFIDHYFQEGKFEAITTNPNIKIRQLKDQLAEAGYSMRELRFYDTRVVFSEKPKGDYRDLHAGQKKEIKTLTFICLEIQRKKA